MDQSYIYESKEQYTMRVLKLTVNILVPFLSLTANGTTIGMSVLCTSNNGCI